MSGIKKLFLPLLAMGLVFGPPAMAQVRANYENANSLFAQVYGNTLPPVGFVGFCSRHAEECRPVAPSTSQIQLTPARWDLMMQVNGFVNRKVAPVTDQELYNKPEMWEYPTNAGDCEDYVLLKKRYLEGLGFPAETLLITVVLDEDGGGHAVLMVRTDSGDFVLDNRRKRILPWYKTGYRYLKRQSQKDPSKWVSLTRGKKDDAQIYSRN